MEIWKETKVHKNYQVSNMGRIRSFAWGKDKIIKGGLDERGYSRINIKGKKYRLHRLIGDVFIRNPKKKPKINHKNGIKLYNRIENLEWCTNLENIRHAIKNGLARKADGRTQSPLKIKDLNNIILWKSQGMTGADIGRHFNICKETINKFLRKESHKYFYNEKL